jgi:alkylation response protein AidB-like acyl-CoA dehydrogenase
MNNRQDWNAMSDGDFRQMVREFVEQNYPPELRFLPHRPLWKFSKPWIMKLADKGWSAPHWPVEYGGMGLSPTKLLIFIDEQERWGVAHHPDKGVFEIGPMIIKFGTEEQRARLLPGMRTYQTIWCQGYSEPNAGSDLASVTTFAEVDGEDFVVTGRKIWTSFAVDATHMFLLARTDTKAKKQEGITFLLLDMSSPGVTVRPIRNIAGGEAEFCEVILDRVRTPRTNMVGALNKGWTVAKSVLGFERINSGSPKRAQFAFERLTALARERGLFSDVAFNERFTRLRLDIADLKAVYAYFADFARRGEPLGPDLSILKILSTETNQRITEYMLESSGDLGVVPWERGTGRVNALTPFLIARARTIGAGTSEIQRNIIAKHVLKLPS